MNEDLEAGIDMTDDDIIMPDDLEGTPTEETPSKQEEQKPVVDQPKVEEPQATPVNEDEKFLEYLNNKGLIKFNGEKVTVKDLDDLVANYQKGLNYDKHNADDELILEYVKGNASKLGISGKDYITRVKDYEKQKEKEQQEADMERYMDRGFTREEANEIIQTRLAREQFERERAELQKRIEADEKKQKEDAEYVEFIKAHPEIKVDEIPQEVFEKAEKIGIDAAYNQYQVKILKEEIEKLKQTQQNVSSSPVGLTSDGGATEQASKDAFLEGFDSE